MNSSKNLTFFAISLCFLLVGANTAFAEKFLEKDYPVLADESAGVAAFLQDFIMPDTWDVMGGDGELGYIPEEAVLRVRQSAEVLAEIDAVFEMVKEWRVPETPGMEREIVRTLDMPITVDVTKMPLKTVLEAISVASGIAVSVDENALRFKELSDGYPITFRCEEGIPLREALEAMLLQHKLAFTICDGGLRITEADDDHLLTRFYLWEDGFMPYTAPEDEAILDKIGDACVKNLIRIMQETCDKDSWEEEGGRGRAGYMRGLFAVRQTWETHEKIRKLLRDLAGKGENPAEGEYTAVPAEDDTDETLVTRVYFIDRRGNDGTDDLISALTQLAEKDSWEDEGRWGTVAAYPMFIAGKETLVISQTREVHREIERFFRLYHRIPRIPSEAEGFVEAILAAPVTLEYKDAPLAEIVGDLRKKIGVMNLLVDENVVDEIGDELFSVSVRSISLENAMNVMLCEKELALRVDGGIVRIMTREEAERNLITEFYPWVFPPKPPVPVSWTEKFEEDRKQRLRENERLFGSGGWRMMDSPDDDGEDDLDDYLNDDSDGSFGGGGGGMFFQMGMEGYGYGICAGPCMSYAMQHATDFEIAADYMASVLVFIAPDSWEVDGGYGKCVPLSEGFFVSQTREVHQKIKKLLADLKEKPLPPTEMETRIGNMLEDRVTWDFQDVPMNEILAELAEKYGVNFRWTLDALDEYDGIADKKITLAVREMPMYEALALLLVTLADGDDLGFYVHREIVLIGTRDEAAKYAEVRVYDAGDIMIFDDIMVEDAGEEDYDYDMLICLLTEMVDPDSWVDDGGWARIGAYIPGKLIILQTAETHRKIEKFLASVRDKPLPPTETETRIAKMLADMVTWDFQDRPMSEILAELTEKYGVDFRWSPNVSAGNDFSADKKITLAVREMPMREAIRLLLVTLPDGDYLGWYILHETVFFGDRDEEAKYADLRIYDVHDLVSMNGELDVAGSDFDWLIMLLIETVAPDSWRDSGGSARIAACPLGYKLVVLQTDENHQEIGRILASLRDKPLPPTASETRMEKMLEDRVTWDFQARKAKEILAELTEKYGVNFRWSPYLSGVCDDFEITLAVRETPMREALQLLADSLRYPGDTELGWYVRHGAVFLSTREEEDGVLELRIYDVRDAIYMDEKGFDYDSLVMFLEENLEPDFWNRESGPGRIGAFFPAKLAILQTRRIHEKVPETLKKYHEGLPPEYRNGNFDEAVKGEIEKRKEEERMRREWWERQMKEGGMFMSGDSVGGF